MTKIFIEGLAWNEALNYFYRNFNLRTQESLDRLKEEVALLSALKTWENLDAGLAEIY